MPYSNTPIFPETENTAPQIQTSDFGNKDLKKIEDTLEEIKSNQTDPAQTQPVGRFFTFDLPQGSVAISEDFSTFSIPNIQEGDTGTILVTIKDGQNVESTLEIQPGVIYNFPYIPGRTVRIDEIENTGTDEKQLSGILI